MNLIKKYCCCWESDDQDVPYRRMTNESSNGVRLVRNEIRGRQRPTENLTNEESDGHPHSSSLQRSPETTKTVAEREEDELNKILQDAQDSVIDVGHLNLQGTLATSEYIERAREYEEAIMSWDTRVNAKLKAQPKQPETTRKLLEECGNKAADWLGRNTVTQASTTQMSEISSRLRNAVDQIKAVPKQELLIDMDF